MRKIAALSLLASAVLVAACAQPAEEGEAVTLRYGIDAGDSLRYRNEWSMEMTTEFSGLPVSELPAGPIEMELEATLDTRYDVAAGPETGAYAVTFGYEDFTDLAMTMRSGGDETTFTEDDLDGALAGSGVPLPGNDVVFVVDDSGHIRSVSVDGTTMPLPGLGGQGMGSFGSQTPFLGPELPDGPVAVGDTWTADWSVELFAGTSVDIQAQSRLVAVEQRDGVEVHVIETTTAADPVTIDLGDLLSGFGGEDLGAPADLAMTMTLRQAPNTSTVWFDAGRGVTVRQEFAGGGDMSMSFTAEGQAGEVTLHMTMSGSLQLLD